jgi:hypothetical protein
MLALKITDIEIGKRQGKMTVRLLSLESSLLKLLMERMG